MRALVVILLAAPLVLAGDEAKPRTWDFEDATPGQLPRGWTAAKTGKGEGSVWKIVIDKVGAKGPNALAQVAVGPSAMFNLCVADEPKLADLEIHVAFKALRGEIDQGGGVLWRYIDADNYYVARMNPLEDNFRLYHVVAGKRTQIATREGLKVPMEEWHTITVRHVGDAIVCSLDGKKMFEAKDSTLPNAGRVGLWTKADARTAFDDLRVTPVVK
ncbi:MAG: DUF1080 domain-containing protein [Gemmataceae bacterium]|nr:DUF1080 domain-containing protein [Gemmataceae bacterium]